MKEQFVTYEIALALKEIGFDEPFTLFNNTIYYEDGKFTFCNVEWKKMFSEREYVLCPLWQQAIDWFREEYNIFIIVYPIECFHNDIPLEIEKMEFSYYIVRKGVRLFCSTNNIFKTYEEALEAGLYEALKLINN